MSSESLGGRRRRRFNVVDYISILSIIVLVAFFTIMNPNFLNAFNIRNMLTDISPLLIMGCGVTFVLLIGSIDLSVGAVCSTAAVILALLFPRIRFWAYPVAALYGVLAGLINGLVFTRVRIPSFIATLGAMSVWQSVAYLISGGAPLQINIKNWGFVRWADMKFGVISLSLVFALVVLAIFWVVQQRTTIGKYSFAIGANERAARLAGVNINLTKVLVFTLCGLASALAGIFLSAKLKSGIPTVGEPLTLMSVAAVALGGTSLAGGKGSVLGTILGVALVTVIQNGMNVIGIDAFWQQIVFGVIVIFAVWMTTDRRGRNVIMK
jgi:ribose transport system permease protein